VCSSKSSNVTALPRYRNTPKTSNLIGVLALPTASRDPVVHDLRNVIALLPPYASEMKRNASLSVSDFFSGSDHYLGPDFRYISDTNLFR